MSVLKDEIINDPLSRGYASMTDHEVADSLNTVNRERDRTIIPAHEIIEATTTTDYNALSADNKQRYGIITGAGEVNIQGTNTRAALAAMFGPGTQTRTNIAALQIELISRATELGLDFVRPGDVIEARL